VKRSEVEWSEVKWSTRRYNPEDLDLKPFKFIQRNKLLLKQFILIAVKRTDI